MIDRIVEQVQSMFYTKHSTLILPISGEGRVLLRLLLTVVGENKKHYIITVMHARYI